MGIGTFREQLKAAIGTSVTSGAYTLTAATGVVVGYDDQGAAGTLVSGIGTSAAKMWIQPGELTGIDPDIRSLRTWTVVCDLYFGFARETDNTFADIEGLIEAILARWDDKANFSGTGRPDEVTARLESVDVKQSPCFAHYVIEVRKKVC